MPLSGSSFYTVTFLHSSGVNTALGKNIIVIFLHAFICDGFIFLTVLCAILF